MYYVIARVVSETVFGHIVNCFPGKLKHIKGLGLR